MIEVVFHKSMKASLLIAQNYGKGQYRESGIGLIVEENQAVNDLKMQEYIKNKEAWDKAVPLGGNREDVFCFDLNLSVGDIREDTIGLERQKVREMLLYVYGKIDESSYIEQMRNRYEVLIQRIANEPVRIWYSHNPDELCGLHWFLYSIKDLKHGPIYVMKLPAYEYDKNRNVVRYIGWGEIPSENLYRYLPLQEEISDAFITGCTLQWEMLKEDNAPLRVQLNEQLLSADEDIYDRYILQVLHSKKEPVYEYELIGNVLSLYQLSIGDTWIKMRIDELIQNAQIEVVLEEEGRYQRLLSESGSKMMK